MIGHLYQEQHDYTNTHIYWGKAKEIHQNIENIDGISTAITHSGYLNFFTGNYGGALACFTEYLQIQNNINNKVGIQIGLHNIGWAYLKIGNLNQAYKSLYQASNAYEKFGNKDELHDIYELLGVLFFNKKEYKQSIKYLEKAKSITGDCLINITYLSLSNAAIGKKYDEKEIHKLIKEAEYIDEELNYPLYQLLEDTSYLETAYNQVQEKADNLEPDIKAKFLSYPIPKAIVEEWEKVK